MLIDTTGCIDSRRLLFLIERNGQPLVQQCKQIGISTATMNRALYENKQLYSESLCKLADYYGVTTDYLLGR